MTRYKRWELAEAQIAIIVAACLQFFIHTSLTLGAKYVTLVLEVVLAIGIGVLASLRLKITEKLRQLFSIVLIAVVTVANITSLALVIHALLSGSLLPGRSLIAAAVAIFLTNIILFALWYWELDSTGLTGLNFGRKAHFLFPQMDLANDDCKKFKPSFFDYLYLSTTNATAFSPTDTMPLTHMTKGLMGLQALVSLLTLVLVAARAVNVLV